MSMTFRQLIESLRSLDADSIVFVRSGSALSGEVETIVVPLDENEDPAIEPDGFREFMDVWHIREVIAGKSNLRDIEFPSTEEAIDMLLEYARDGA